MRILRWIFDNIKKCRIKRMRSWVFGIESIGDKLRKTLLRWFRHVQCRATTVQLIFYQKRIVQLIKKKVFFM